MRVDNNSIQHNCEKLMQEFEKFVVMAMNLGANFDSLPIPDNPDNFVVHSDLHLSWSSSIPCHSSTLLEITLLAQLQSNACSESSLVCPILVHHLLGTTAMIVQARYSFQHSGTKHGCDGGHGAGLLFLCVCVSLLACRATWFSAAQSHFHFSRQLQLCCLNTQNAFT